MIYSSIYIPLFFYPENFQQIIWFSFLISIPLYETQFVISPVKF